MGMNKIWLHIISDLYECELNVFHDRKKSKIMKVFAEIIKQNWLGIVWKCIHVFWWLSFTLVILLEESHISIHTRPEYNYISLDLFVCNYQKDNSHIAKKVFNDIKSLVKNKKEKTRFITRKTISS